MRKWKQLADKLLEAAKVAEEEGRCRKTKTIMQYMGSFVEMPAQVRCLLDNDHEGDCIIDDRKLKETG